VHWVFCLWYFVFELTVDFACIANAFLSGAWPALRRASLSWRRLGQILTPTHSSGDFNATHFTSNLVERGACSMFLFSIKKLNKHQEIFRCELKQ
jgi:hypothetical protein